jgi:hypothetical protein
MTPRKAVFLLTLLVCAGGIAVAHADEKPKEQAKDLADKAKGEGNDRVKQVQDFCSAAQLDPKEKKYADLCSSYRSGLIQDDTAMLASAIAAYKSNDLNRAESQAKLVSSYDQKLSGQARFVLDLVRNQRVVYQIQADWKSGDLDAILSLSQVLTNADAKAAVAGAKPGAKQSRRSHPATDVGQNSQSQWPWQSSRNDCRFAECHSRKKYSAANANTKNAGQFSRRHPKESCETPQRCARSREAGQTAGRAQRLCNGAQASTRKLGSAKQYGQNSVGDSE